MREFALPAQPRALTYMLGLEETEADIWISRGTHVFRDGKNAREKGQGLEHYLRAKLTEACNGRTSEDIFSILVRTDGRISFQRFLLCRPCRLHG